MSTSPTVHRDGSEGRSSAVAESVTCPLGELVGLRCAYCSTSSPKAAWDEHPDEHGDAEAWECPSCNMSQHFTRRTGIWRVRTWMSRDLLLAELERCAVSHPRGQEILRELESRLPPGEPVATARPAWIAPSNFVQLCTHPVNNRAALAKDPAARFAG